MKRLAYMFVMLILLASTTQAAEPLTATIEFDPAPEGHRIWVYAGVVDCNVDTNGVLLPENRMNCPYGQIGEAGATFVNIGNIPPGATVYATATWEDIETGLLSPYSQVVSSLAPGIVRRNPPSGDFPPYPPAPTGYQLKEIVYEPLPIEDGK